MSDSPKNPPILEVVKGARKPKPAVKKPAGGNNGGGGAGKNKGLKFGSYQVIDNSFFQLKPDADGNIKEINLCNFTCKIVEEVRADDGLCDEQFLKIEGRRFDGKPLPLAEVPLKNFFSSQGNWTADAWGMLPFIPAGASKKDNLRACIQQYSQIYGDIPCSVVYRYTGWKKINEQWHYLTGSGAITAAGLIDDVVVDPGQGHMSKYKLPKPLADDPLKQAVNDALLLLDVCPGKPHIGAALLAAAVRAPLGECQPTDFAIWLHGLTGSRKSAAAAIVQAFFGDFTDRSFPANWSDSVNNCEVKSHQAKDGVFTVDDFKPSVSQAEAAKLHAMAERLIRNTGNQAGRGRLEPNAQTKAAPYNRSLMLVTAEDLPRGQSLLGRLLILELSKTDVDNIVLTKLQAAARAGSFSGLMAAYLQWMAARLDQFKNDFPVIVEQTRNGVIRDGFAVSHSRAPEIFSNLVAGAEIFLDFLTEVGAVTSEKGNALLCSVEGSLKQAFADQGKYQAEQDETERFIQLLRAVLSSGNGHIADRLKQGPPELRPFVWGWRESVETLGDKSYMRMGDCIGWHCEVSTAGPAEVWLNKESVFRVVQKFARDQGDAFLMQAPTLWRRMQEKGLILKSDHGRTDIKRTVCGVSRKVLVMSAELIESG